MGLVAAIFMFIFLFLFLSGCLFSVIMFSTESCKDIILIFFHIYIYNHEIFGLLTKLKICMKVL